MANKCSKTKEVTKALLVISLTLQEDTAKNFFINSDVKKI
jgi:hypothetical protein